MERIWGFALMMLLFGGIGCQTANPPATQPSSAAADIQAIQAVSDAYVVAESAGDATAVASLYADDGVLMPANEPSVSGRAAIETHLRENYAMMTVELSATSRETKSAGDIGYHAGTHRVRLTPKSGGDAIEATGKHVVTLARQADGSWKITNLIFNADAPGPPMPPPSE